MSDSKEGRPKGAATARRPKSPLCNACGLTCLLGPPGERSPHGLLRVAVSGGYESTPGNGYGALDDLDTYTFSLCEFCVDALLSQLRIPPRVASAIDHDPTAVFRPAAQRVAEDEWRGMRAEFTRESARRAKRRTK